MLALARKNTKPTSEELC